MTASWAAQGLAAALAEPAAATEEGVTAALAELGGTPTQVAATLDTGQHYGDRGCAFTCPVADYLWTRFPTCAQILVGHSSVLIYLDRDSSQFTFRVPIPAPVAEFAAGFDTGSYSALDAAGVTR